MATILIDILLAVVVIACSAAAFGLLRLKEPLEQLQCVAAVNAVAAPAIAIAALVADGFSGWSIRMLVLGAALALSGTALANLTSGDSFD